MKLKLGRERLNALSRQELILYVEALQSQALPSEGEPLPVDPLAVLAARHDLALRASKVGVWDWDIQANHLLWDDMMFEVYGTHRDKFGSAYEAWLAGVFPDDKEESDAEVKRALAGECDFDAQFRVVWDNGELHTIRALATILRDDDGTPLRMIGANWDVTAEMTIRTALEQSNDDLSQFVYRTSHDLRAPLATIRGLSGLILDDIADGDTVEAAQNVRKVARQAEKLHTFIDDILALSRANSPTAGNTLVNLEALLVEVTEKMTDFYPTAQVAVRTEIVGPADIVAPRLRLAQILENLVSNAFKYRDPTEEHPCIEVTFRTDSARSELSVKDNGRGIPKEFHDDIFTMFSRFHSDVATGSGLGLSIVKRHVDQMSGHIELVPSDRGAHFRLSFPHQQPNDS